MQDDHNGCFLAFYLWKSRILNILSEYKICFKNFAKSKRLATQATLFFFFCHLPLQTSGQIFLKKIKLKCYYFPFLHIIIFMHSALNTHQVQVHSKCIDADLNLMKGAELIRTFLNAKLNQIQAASSYYESSPICVFFWSQIKKPICVYQSQRKNTYVTKA